MPYFIERERRRKSRRPIDLMWFYIVLCVIGFVLLVAKVRGDELQRSPEKPRIVFVGASWCAPCVEQKKTIVPELIRRGHDVLIFDIDDQNARRLFPARSVPAWYILGEPMQAANADEVVANLATPVAAAAAAPDLVAQLRKFLGTKKPTAHSSFAWSFEEPQSIELDAKTTIIRPKLLSAECDFKEDVLTVTFARPLPQASVQKAGATITVDVPRVQIKKNVITATADIAFGIQKTFEFTVTKSPFDE